MSDSSNLKNQDPQTFCVGKNESGTEVFLRLDMSNRHGLIAGATGTGKTVTLQVLLEAFSAAGVPTFVADVKGDLSGVAVPGETEKIQKRLDKLGITSHTSNGYPVVFWDVYGENGHPVRTTLSEMGPILLGRLLDLSDAQQGVLQIAFAVADDEGLPLLDMKDLKSMLVWLGDNSAELRKEYGNIATNSLGALQRKLLEIEERGGDLFFGEPALKIDHLMARDFSGQGVISVLHAAKLMQDSRIYSTFLLWLLSELFEELEEVGDPEKPRLVFFFDEAHLLFKDTPKALLDKIEQMTRLIRSKGVGVFYVTQSPLDIPETVLGQLGNRFQHALRAFSPKGEQVVRSAARTLRENPKFNCEEVLTELGVGEALVSTLQKDGTPGVVERTLMNPPHSRMGPLSAPERTDILGRSPYKGTYEEVVDRDSAYERLQVLMKKRAEEAEAKAEEEREEKSKGGYKRQGVFESMVKSVVRSVGSSIGRQIARGILGSITGKR